ncbi:single-stranded DNA-binding protein [Klebsiella pneumoniae]|uniref:single-stranded DNA-binding protein n=1 Tax=Klebsiella pneumoniae TaxID=573 RepID=UPI00388EA461
MTLATSETWRDKQTGDARNTEWHRVVMFGKLQWKWRVNTCVKGTGLQHEGQLRTRNWQDDAGVTRYVTERCWSGRTAPCRCSAAAVNPECLRAPRSRRIPPPRHNLLRPQLNPRKRRAVRKSRQDVALVSATASASPGDFPPMDDDAPFKPR